MASQSTERDEARDWLERYHKATATLDGDLSFDQFFTDDYTLQYGNAPDVSGEEGRKGFRDILAKLDKMEHEIREFDVVPKGVSDSRIYQSAIIHYVVKGDDPSKDMISIPRFAMFDRRRESDGQMKCYRSEVYLDVSPLFQRMATKELF